MSLASELQQGITALKLKISPQDLQRLIDYLALLQNRDDMWVLLYGDVGSVKILAATAMGELIPIAALVVWRTAYGSLLKQPYPQERGYVLGTGEHEQRLDNGLGQRAEQEM